LNLKSTDIFVTCIAASSNGKYIAIGNNNGDVQVFDLKDENRQYNLAAHSKMIRDIKFTNDDLKLITVSDDLYIHIIDLTKM